MYLMLRVQSVDAGVHWRKCNQRFFQVKFVFSKMTTNLTKSSPSIWHLLHNIKSTVKISSIFVAFLENMNFKGARPVSLKYRKVTSSILSRLVAHPRIFRPFKKGNFDAYALWPLEKMVYCSQLLCTIFLTKWN